MMKLTRYLLFLVPALVASCGLVAEADHPQDEKRALVSVSSYPAEILRVDPLIGAGEITVTVNSPPTEPAITEKPKRDYVEMTVIATAYCPCRRCCGPNARGLTKTELSAWRPGIAVDPRVIPLGSVLAVPGYNNDKPTFADDVGGKIKGKRIDVRMTYHWQAKEWGTQTLVVKVWKPR